MRTMTSTKAPPPAVRRGPARKVAMMLALGPPAAAMLALERRFPQWWTSRFPRTVAEIEQNPSCLGTLITKPSPGLITAPPLPAGAVAHGQRRLEGLAHEPGKDLTLAKWELSFRSGDAVVPVRVVTKLQSGRNAPLYMQALRAVFERDFLREVAFYRHLAAIVPVRVARAYFADGEPSINRACLVLEAIDGVTPSDAQGCRLDDLRGLLDAAAALNAQFAGRLDGPETAWIPAREGLEFADWTELFLGKESKNVQQLWAAMKTYFQPRPVTLAHGDCRPGNMLFTSDGVVMSDWEAINIAPLLWDFTYCTITGLHVEDRQAHLDVLLDAFLDRLRRGGVSIAPARDQARIEVDLLAMVLAFVSLFVVERGLWAQGNATADVRAWLTRVKSAVVTLDAERAATVLAVPPALVREFQDVMRARPVLREDS